MKLILASNSPRRKEILSGLRIPFTIKIKDVAEDFEPHLQREQIAEHLAGHKAAAYKTDLQADEVVLTADTIVWLQNSVLNKPKDLAEAKEMLQRLSGNVHEVITGVCLQSRQKQEIFHDVSKVYFRKLSEKEIDFYLEHFKPLDKAGAYGVQEFIGMIGIERIEGSYFNVMGLPVHLVYEKLKGFGLDLESI
ncbi:Maf-like protein [Adhaeribacter terrigena]|uniref:Maf-like protein n=1 Tax=Adhaeribacter terrigena TaxID=2793070 RepID=UPI00293D72FF|nr:Maf-like protein [Adhaeribacter terrigena]